jgi:hypothetical protein
VPTDLAVILNFNSIVIPVHKSVSVPGLVTSQPSRIIIEFPGDPMEGGKGKPVANGDIR